MNDKQRVGTGMIPTEELILGQVPWTKPEVRAVTIAQLNLQPDQQVLEIGAGTGTVTLEIARRLDPVAGRLVAIERKEQGCRLIQANLEKFQLTNVELIQSLAPEGLPDREWDRIFIGGSGGNLSELLSYALEHLKSSGILVLNTVTLDSLLQAQSFFTEQGLECETILLQVSRIQKVGGYSMYQGENPIHILTFRKSVFNQF